MTATTASVQTFRYRAVRSTDDVTSCDLCGREDLKGTVLLALVDEDGDVSGEIYAGVICAARAAGKKAAEIRREVTAAEAATREARRAHRAARHAVSMALTDEVLRAWGVERDLYSSGAAAKESSVVAALAAWDAAHPAP